MNEAVEGRVFGGHSGPTRPLYGSGLIGQVDLLLNGNGVTRSPSVRLPSCESAAHSRAVRNATDARRLSIDQSTIVFWTKRSRRIMLRSKWADRANSTSRKRSQRCRRNSGATGTQQRRSIDSWRRRTSARAASTPRLAIRGPCSCGSWASTQAQESPPSVTSTAVLLAQSTRYGLHFVRLSALVAVSSRTARLSFRRTTARLSLSLGRRSPRLRRSLPRPFAGQWRKEISPKALALVSLRRSFLPRRADLNS